MSKWVRCLAMLTVMCCVMVTFGQDTTDTGGTDLLAGFDISAIVIVLVFLAILSGLFGFNIPFLGGLFGG